MYLVIKSPVTKFLFYMENSLSKDRCKKYDFKNHPTPESFDSQ